MNTVSPQSSQTVEATTGKGSPLPRRALLTAFTAVLLVLIGVASAGSASAWTYSNRSSVPVLPTIYQVQGAHYNSGSAVTGPMWRPWVYQSGPIASRTTPTGAQSVSVTYTVQRWNGSAWAHVTNVSGSATIAAGSVSAKLPNLSVLPNAGSGYYRVQLALTWTSPIGAVQGSMNAQMSRSGDYVCSTSRTCTAYAGQVYIGS